MSNSANKHAGKGILKPIKADPEAYVQEDANKDG